MSSKGRLLRKLRRIMGVAVASSGLVACSSQISCGVSIRYGNFCYDLDLKGELTISTYAGIRATFGGIPKKFWSIL